MTTPIAMDTFSRFMADMFDEKEVINVSTGFQAFFAIPGSGANTIFSPNANVVDIDIIRGNEKTAALIPRGTLSRPIGDTQKNMNVEKYTAFSRKYPLTEEEGDITADQILNRVAGEGPYEVRSRFDRMRMLGLKLHNESIRRIVRMFERLAAQSVLTGVMDAILGTTNTDLQYDFRRDAALTITVGTAWDQALATIMADIDGACDLIRAKGRITPDMAVIGAEALGQMLVNTDFLALADNRRIELIQVSTNNPVPSKFNRFVEAGFIPRGRLRTESGYELWLFTYIDGYDTDAGVFTKYMPVNEMLIASSGVRCDRYFGPPELLPLTPAKIANYQAYFGFNPMAAPMPVNIKSPGNLIDPSMFYADAYESGDGKKISIRTQAAPIFATTQTDAFAVLNGLITP